MLYICSFNTCSCVLVVYQVVGWSALRSDRIGFSGAPSQVNFAPAIPIKTPSTPQVFGFILSCLQFMYSGLRTSQLKKTQIPFFDFPILPVGIACIHSASMERQRLQEGIEALRGAQVRREHHTILGHIVEIEKRMVRLDEESRQEFAVLRENIANLSQQLKEIEENSVTQKEWQWHKDRELARTERDKFVATGAFGGSSIPRP